MRPPKQFRATAYPQLLLGHGYTVSARPTRFRVRLRWCEILHHPRRCCDQCRSWCNALHHWRRRCGHCRSWSNALHHWRKCCDHCRSWCDVLRNSRRCCDHGRGWCDAPLAQVLQSSTLASTGKCWRQMSSSALAQKKRLGLGALQLRH